MSDVMSLRRKHALKVQARAQREAELTARRQGRTAQAARSTVPVGVADVPLVDAVDTAVTVGADLPGVQDDAVLAGDDAWEAWDQSEFAKQIAEGAAQAAEDAQTSADGKSRVVRSTSAATAAGSYSAGDQWWQFSGPYILGLWLHDGTDWVQQVVTNQIIASLDAGKITSGVIAADRIGANSITTAKLASTAIDGMTITGAVLRTAASGQRWQISPTGIVGYDALNVARVTMLPSAQGLSITGGSDGQALVRGGDMRVILGDDLVFTNVSSYRAGHTLQRTLPGSPSGRSVVDSSAFSTSALHSVEFVPPGGGTGCYVSSTASETTAALTVSAPGGSLWMLTREAGANRVVVTGPTTRFENAIDAAGGFLGDTAWANATLPAGVTGIARWKRFNNTIWVQFNLTSSTSIPADGLLTPAFTLPSAAWPEVNSALGVVGAGTWPALGWLSAATGACTIRNLRSTGQTSFYGSGQWPAPGT